MPQYMDVPSVVSLLLIQELLERCRLKKSQVACELAKLHLWPCN